MTAAWKQKKFERLAQKDVVEELKNQVRLLQDKLTDHKHKDKYRDMQMHEVYKQRDEAMVLANRYNRLRTEEIMIATPDGFKLVTGEELDIHCGQIEAKTQAWWGQPLKPMTYTISADDAMDGYSLTHAQHIQLNEKFQRALEQSMLQTKEVMRESIYGLHTRSKSKETDQEDS